MDRINIYSCKMLRSYDVIQCFKGMLLNGALNKGVDGSLSSNTLASRGGGLLIRGYIFRLYEKKGRYYVHMYYYRALLCTNYVHIVTNCREKCDDLTIALY